ncbi:MAG: hypothetical protein HY658_04340 [Actinobacteria bacterium]|nr:hypothetical protein [Actinomycetota bacterium]
MGTVIDLAGWLRRQDRGGELGPPSVRASDDDPVARLDAIVSRLDPLLEEVKAARRRDALVETEILAITGALSLGLAEEAADRAERLVARLEDRSGRTAHPAGKGSPPRDSVGPG